MITTVLAFLFTLGVLIVVHEYGHYRVAVACGVRVLRFSIGFGRVLWRRQATPESTEFVLCALPLGGYVRMLDEREAPVAGERARSSFQSQAARATRRDRDRRPGRQPVARCRSVLGRALDRRRRAEGPARAARGSQRRRARRFACRRLGARLGEQWRRMAGRALAHRPALAGHAIGPARRGHRPPRERPRRPRPAPRGARSRIARGERGRCQVDAADRSRQSVERAGAGRREGRWRRRRGRAAPGRPGARHRRPADRRCDPGARCDPRRRSERQADADAVVGAARQHARPSSS